MIFKLNFLDKKLTILTNSLILKDYIENGLNLLFLKDKIPDHLTFSFILKNPSDSQEVLKAFIRLESKILRIIKDNYFIFHASAFSFNGKATMVLGDAGSGKSSLCFLAGLWGGKILTDEPVLIEKKSFKILPFRYLIKITDFRKNFSSLKWDFKQNRIIEKNYEFNIFTKQDLKRLNINLEYRSLYLKNIIFLEEKKYDNLLHLTKHWIHPKRKLLKSLNELIKEKNISFIPDFTYNLKNKKSLRDLKRMVLCLKN